MTNRAAQPRAVVVGGSIAGLSCAHALLSVGWQVTVLEKSPTPTSGNLTGAGLGLDPQSLQILSGWLPSPDLLLDATVPLSIDLNRVTDSEAKISRTLTRDDGFNFRAAHWTDLHSILFRTLPPGTVRWGHHFLSFQVSESGEPSSIVTRARVIGSDEVVEFEGDLLVGADGCSSAIRRHFLPDSKLRYLCACAKVAYGRYSGYYAWRGVLDISGKEMCDVSEGIHQAYPELGDCLYFDLANSTHCVLYELKNKKLNWLWYINGPEPEPKGNSATIKVSDDMIKTMHKEAEKVWVPKLARVMRETKEPFINIIYDSDPLPQLYCGNVVLVGDAAHPTTPHGLRSTNMSIQDARILSHCIEKWGQENPSLALEEFQRIRLPIVSQQVLHARKLGRMKQGLLVGNQKSFDPMAATPVDCKELQQRSMPYFEGVPFTC